MSDDRVEGHFPASDVGEGSPEDGNPPQVYPLPDALVAELVKMRRNPADFTVSGLSKCKFCSKSKIAYTLLNAKSGPIPVGAWCATHGWLFFESVRCPSTERLTAWEVEDSRLAEQRRAAWARRKAGKVGDQKG